MTPSTATGTVTFKDGTTTLGTATLASGVATFPTTFGSSGAHSLTAVYGGDASDGVSTSAALTQTVTLASTATSLTSSVNPSLIGASTTLAASVTPTIATGIVTFKDGTTTLGTSTVTSGVATLAKSFATSGTHNLTAVYGGDTKNATSTSNALAQTVNSNPTVISLTTFINPIAVGALTTLTANVSPSTATGTVTFKDGTTTLGTDTLGSVVSGMAQWTTSFSSTGAHSLTATYGGDTNNATSTSSVVVETVGVATSTVLASSVNSIVIGANTSLTATVTPSSATGTVTFKDGTAVLGTGTLNAGVATLAASFATVGSHSLTAVYGGDLGDITSTSSALVETVTANAATVFLTSSLNPSTVDDTVVLTATVTPPAATGKISFMDGATKLAAVNLGSGVATISVYFSNQAGTHNLTAIYAGDANYATATSATLAEAVIGKANTTVLTSSFNPVNIGQSTTLTATNSLGWSAGTITFFDGATSLGTVPVTTGIASLVTSFSGGATHSLRAAYSGDIETAPSTGALTQAVSLAATATTLSSGTNPGVVGTATTLTATVTPPTATGIVTFLDGSTVLGTATLGGGTATYSAAFSTTGTHSLTASYAGNATDAASTSGTLVETVTPKPSTVLTSSVNPAVIGQTTTLTATVTPPSATGVVTFMDGAIALGAAPVALGIASYSAKFTIAGTHTLTANYSGDANDAANSSNSLTETVQSGPVTTSTLLGTSANLVSAGQSLTLTATVSGDAPTGTVQFKDGAVSLGSPVTLVGGQASFNLMPPVAAGHLYSATYSGDPYNSTSSGQAAVNVTGATSTTSLSSSSIAATPTTSITLTATVTGSGPTGSIVFRDGAAVLNTATVAGGIASWTQTLTGGMHVITASYSGDATNSASASTATSIQISADGSVQPPTALQWTYQYDAQGNPTQVTNANTATTQQVYDSLSRSTKITLPVPATGQAAPVIGLTYDLQDQPAKVTDPRTLTTTYTVDGLGSTTALTTPDTGALARTYYDNGLLQTAVDARGRTSTFTYDALDRLSSVSYSDGGTGIVMGYDAGTYGKGNLTSISDESGSTSFVYDGLGRVVTKTQVSGPSGAQRTFTLNYAWGSSGTSTGKLASVTYPSGAIVTYGYDTAGRINDVSVTGADGVVSKVLSGLAYDALSQPKSWVWGIGAVPYLRSFDGYGRLVSYPLGNPSGTGIAAGVLRTLAFDAAGRIVGYSHTTPTNWDQFFGYDGLDRLVSASLTGGDNYGYSYDLTGNRTQTTINGTVYADTVSSTSNWYTNVATAAGGATAQGYDTAGHLTSDTNGTYTYSGRGRLKTALRSGNTFSYLYNAFEQRVYKAGPSSVITTGVASYVYDEAGHLVGEYDATGKAVYETVYLGDMPVAALTQSAIGQTTVSYVYADHLNTARVIVRPADQAIVWSWGANEPFGQTQANSNPNSLGVYTYNPRFPGQVADTESGWYYNWYRDYNPALGRYVQSDPIGLASGSMSTYGYVNGNPLSAYDDMGLQTLPGPMGLPIPIIPTPQQQALNKQLAQQLTDALNGNSDGDPQKTYQTYTRWNPTTKKCYSGRTSGTGTPQENVKARGQQQTLLNNEGFQSPILDTTTQGDSFAEYLASRGREEQIISLNGGAKSRGGTSRNAIGGIVLWPSAVRNVAIGNANARFGEPMPGPSPWGSSPCTCR